MSTPLLLLEEDIESGGKEDLGGIENDFAYRNNVHNAHIKIRLAFLRKVYGLLSVQLLMTIAVSVVFKMSESIKTFVQTNPWMMGSSFLLTFGVLIALHLKRRDHPANLILLGIFTLIQSYTVGTIVTMFETQTVLQALVITFTIVAGLTIYTLQSKKDFSFLGFGLFAALMALLVGGIIQIFIQSTVMEVLLGIGGALLFALFIIFDTHQLMHTLSPEEYVLAAINIYLDIINLFLHILRILAASKQ